jgi:hypothetical protein
MKHPNDATDFNCATDRYPYRGFGLTLLASIVLGVLAWALIVLGCAYAIHAIRTRPVPPPQHTPAPFSVRAPIAILLCALAVSCASPNPSPDYPLRVIRDPVTEELPDVQFAP